MASDNHDYSDRADREYSSPFNQQGATQTTTMTTVQAPTQPIHSTQTTTKVAQPAEEGTVVTWDQVQQNQPPYKLLEKKGRKEVYLDNQTGQKVTVKREKD